MIIQSEKLPHLLTWLSKELKPLTLADAGTLAEYVIALLKNEKENDALKAHCIEQLTDFLKSNTEPFIKQLFNVIEDESYIVSESNNLEFSREEEDVPSRDIPRRRRAYEDDDDESLRAGTSPRNKPSVYNSYEDDDGDDNEMYSKRRRQDEYRPSSERSHNHTAGGRYNRSNDKNGFNHSNRFNHNVPSSTRNYNNMTGMPLDYSFAGGRGMPWHLSMPKSIGLMPGYDPLSASFTQDGLPMQNSGGPGMMNGPGLMPSMFGYVPSNGLMYQPQFSQFDEVWPSSSFGSLRNPQQSAAQYSSSNGSLSNSQFPHGTLQVPLGNSIPQGSGNFQQGGLLLQGTSTTPKNIQPPTGPPPKPNHTQQQFHSPVHRNMNELPEDERCTLRCTGIPAHIQDSEILAHFRQFGRVIELQVTVHPVTEANTNALNGDDKKSYNECLVQFGTANEAKKCYNSPTPVLNNRFIRIYYSDFNIIPPSDVEPLTQQQELELKLQQEQYSSTQKNQIKQNFSNMNMKRIQPNRGITPSFPSSKRFINRKYVAGNDKGNTTLENVSSHEKRDDTEPIAINESVAIIDSTVDVESNDTVTIEPNHTASEETETDINHSQHHAVDSHSRIKLPKTSTVTPKPAAVKAEKVLQQQFEDLRKLRSEAELIWKKKEALIQGQIDQYRVMMNKLEKGNESKSKLDILEDLESKIMNLQSQLRNVREQREKGITAPPPTQAAIPMGPARGRGGRGLRGAGRGRFQRGGRVGYASTFQQPSTKNFVLDNRPKTFVITSPPEGFLDEAENHFGRFPGLMSISVTEGSNIMVEFASRKEAEVAIAQGVKYNSISLSMEWFHSVGNPKTASETNEMGSNQHNYSRNHHPSDAATGDSDDLNNNSDANDLITNPDTDQTAAINSSNNSFNDG